MKANETKKRKRKVVDISKLLVARKQKSLGFPVKKKARKRLPKPLVLDRFRKAKKWEKRFNERMRLRDKLLPFIEFLVERYPEKEKALRKLQWETVDSALKIVWLDKERNFKKYNGKVLDKMPAYSGD